MGDEMYFFIMRTQPEHLCTQLLFSKQTLAHCAVSAIGRRAAMQREWHNGSEKAGRHAHMMGRNGERGRGRSPVMTSLPSVSR